MKGSPPAERIQPESPELRAGRLSVSALRRATLGRLWGGKGCGAPCDFCRVLVSPTEIEYEVEAELDGVPLTLHFHRRCHDLWRSDWDSASPAERDTTQPE